MDCNTPHRCDLDGPLPVATGRAPTATHATDGTASRLQRPVAARPERPEGPGCLGGPGGPGGPGRRPRWTAPLIALVAFSCAAPSLGDPGRPERAREAAPACWSPGSAPALFAWSASPGIACRNGADGSVTARSLPVAPSDPGQPPARPGKGQPAQITFSATAYVGIAATF